MLDSVIEEDQNYASPQDRSSLLGFRRHGDQAINALLEDRARKNALADEFARHVARRIAEGNLREPEIRRLFAQAHELRNICVPDERPYDPTGRKVIWAVSFNGSFQLTKAMFDLHAYTPAPR